MEQSLRKKLKTTLNKTENIEDYNYLLKEIINDIKYQIKQTGKDEPKRLKILENIQNKLKGHVLSCKDKLPNSQIKSIDYVMERINNSDILQVLKILQYHCNFNLLRQKDLHATDRKELYKLTCTIESILTFNQKEYLTKYDYIS